MDNLLKNDFTTHYGLPISTVNIIQNINYKHFEIEDVNRTIIITNTRNGTGTARYSNATETSVVVIDYDKFLTSMPHAFQNGKKRCDLILYTINNSNFILNELKDRNPTNSSVLTKATLQMLASLDVIMPVPAIATFINNFATKKCCYSNKQSISPTIVNATTAFNRLSNILPPNGIRLSNPAIEAYGFELYEYTGTQTIQLY